MTSHGWKRTRIGNFTGRMLEGFRLLPVLLTRPAVALHWLLGARAAQIALVVLALTVPTIITAAADGMLEKLYPPMVHEELFGLMKKTYSNPRLARGKVLARHTLYAGSGCLLFALLILHIPSAVKNAGERARTHEGEADSLIETEPSRSILLYRTALKLATDPEHADSLKTKIRSFDERYLGGAGEGKMAGRASTVILPGEERTLESQEMDEGGSFQKIGPAHRYRIQGRLGRGSTGITYRAHDSVLEREVALKELLPDLADDPELSSRFRQEARVLAQLTHPLIVQVFDFIEEDGRIWIVMELVRGGELADLLKERGHLRVPEAVRIGAQMAEAMAYAHERGVVHRDFKPSNVMLTPAGEPKIADFGLAKFTQSSQHTTAGTVVGSPYYMSPEQAEGRNTDWRTDIYSAGVVFYQMLTGTVPFDGDSVGSVLAQQVTAKPVPPTEIRDGIPGELDGLILSMLAKDPEQRTHNMGSVAEILKKFMEDSAA